MGKIGDIWVRLGLKKDGYTKGLNEAKKETQGFGASLGKMKAGALAVWTAIGASVIGFAKQMISATNRIGDAWNHSMAQMKAGWDVFLQSLSNWNWDNFIGRIRESVTAAKELQGILDNAYENQNSIRLQRAEMAPLLSELEIAIRDRGRTDEERLAAANQYRQLIEGLYQQDIAQKTEEASAQVRTWIAGTPLESALEGLDSDSKEYKEILDGIIHNFSTFIKEYSQKDKEMMDAIGTTLAGEPAAPAFPTITTARNLKRHDEEMKAWQKARDEYYAAQQIVAEKSELYGFDVLQYGRIYENYRNDESNGAVIESLIALGDALAASKRENRRIIQMQNNLAASLAEDGQTSAEPPAPSGSRAALQEELEKAQEAAANAVGEEAIAQADATVRAIEEKIQAMNLWSETMNALKDGTYVDRFLGDIDIPDEEYKFNDKIDLSRKKTDIDVPELTSGMKDYTSSIYEASNAIGVLGGALSNITALVDDGAASWISYGTNIIQAIAQAIPAIASLTAAKNAEATANAASAATGAGSAVASIPYVGPAMAIAAIASVIAALANIPKFADGGIVGGSSYYGDRILARLNSGELVLNQSQQAGLLNMIDRPTQNIHLDGAFRVSGRDLRLVLDKYDYYRRQ